MGMGVCNISGYTPSSTDTYLFDNNIWMFIFCPIANVLKKKQREYSSFLQSILSVKASIFVTSMILSEFANAYLRLDYDLWKKDTRQYSANYKKDYLKSERYRETSKEVISSIKAILKLTEAMPDDFHMINIDNILTLFEKIDFNDSYYIELCKTKSLKIVTDDRDFGRDCVSEITIISSL
ncbi:hypothetical protein ACRFA2_04625 [Bacteroides hominis]|uniref:hypothetical protein n=1 Tax=Bacteroides TaxID=816 RepID=UPI0022AACFD0|nr:MULTISPECIES: hypothetical protein [Bacteroides]MCZ2615798.1 hypothetical protein [Bacteroides fragilis]MCZ2622682.1 hypothetical protein [Bacteroides fragilis]MDV6171968.1 hypothetical protein [Bacteroides hominis (ex Liu et al. 2022)]